MRALGGEGTAVLILEYGIEECFVLRGRMATLWMCSPWTRLGVNGDAERIIGCTF